MAIIDSLPDHRVSGGRQAIEAAGATRLLQPPYSPEFNPTEQTFAKRKVQLRRIAPRTKDALWQDVAEVPDAFTPQKCAIFFRNSGHEPE